MAMMSVADFAVDTRVVIVRSVFVRGLALLPAVSQNGFHGQYKTHLPDRISRHRQNVGGVFACEIAETHGD